MCAISGVVIFREHRSEYELQQIENRLRALIRISEDRGRDSWGFSSFGRDGDVIEHRALGRASKGEWPALSITQNTVVVIANNRAEPTTEYVKNKTDRDIQPFHDSSETLWVSHNGLIANDKDLRKSCDRNIPPSTKIDTQTLVEYLKVKWDGRSRNELAKILSQEVIGSFALALYDMRSPNSVTLAANYKPIFMMRDDSLSCIFFASLPEYLQRTRVGFSRQKPIEQIPPYSVIQINSLQRYVWYSRMPIPHSQKVLVVCSGGLDSVTLASDYIAKGYDVTLLHFKYQCRAQSREEIAIKEVATALNVPYMMVETDIFKSVIGHSRLTDTKASISKDGEGESGAELAIEWVPARNLIFYSLAVGIAEAHNFGIVALGLNLEEGGAYPDNEAIFASKLNEVMPYAVNLNKKVVIEAPFANMMKHEIVRRAIDLNAPIQHAWSCYDAGEIHCGSCGPCYLRRTAFMMNAVVDPIKYEREESSDFWDDCVSYDDASKKVTLSFV